MVENGRRRHMRMASVTGIAILVALLMVNPAFASSCDDYCDPGA
jgi:hypothetical protein